MAMAGEETLKLWLGSELMVEVSGYDLLVYIIQPPRCLQAMVMGEVFLKKLPLILKALRSHIEWRIERLRGKESLSYGDRERLEVLEKMNKCLSDIILYLMNMAGLVEKLKELDRSW